MHTSTKVLGTAGAAVAACAACCAVSIVPAVFAGSSLIALGCAAASWGTKALLVAVPLGGLYYVLRRRPKAPAATFNALMTSADGCGCGGSCRPSSRGEAVIACSLDAGDFKTRTTDIRALAQRSLRSASRTRLTLSLIYGPEALAEVQELVRKEEDCCAFLTFDLTHDAAGVYLTITAPDAAAEAADMLFAHFAPDAAQSLTEKELA